MAQFSAIFLKRSYFNESVDHFFSILSHVNFKLVTKSFVCWTVLRCVLLACACIIVWALFTSSQTSVARIAALALCS